VVGQNIVELLVLVPHVLVLRKCPIQLVYKVELRPSEKITFTILSFRFDRVVPIAVEFFGSKA
jgi:hypothetical protein